MVKVRGSSGVLVLRKSPQRHKCKCVCMCGSGLSKTGICMKAMDLQRKAGKLASVKARE